MELRPQSVNIFIGQNNSGKGNILDAIEYALKNTPAESKYYYPKADVEVDIDLSEAEAKLLQLKPGTVKVTLKNQERTIEMYGQKLVSNDNGQKFFSKCVKRLDEAAFENSDQIESDYHSLFNFPNSLEKFKQSLRRHFPKISASKNALDLQYDHEGLYEGERRVTIDRLGSGFQRIFVILLYIYHPQYSVVMIDEPEIHLHPAIIKHLYWAIENAQAGQVFFTTHSPLFIRPATLSQVVRVVKKNNTTRAFSMLRTKYDPHRLTQELNADNLEMFFADKVLLVEGVSDRLLFRGLIDRFYEQDKEIKVVQIQGKGNVKIYLDLLETFQIPLAIVLDHDALNNYLVKETLSHMGVEWPSLAGPNLIDFLKRYNIFILQAGDLEDSYPQKYQNQDTKSANALRAASLITSDEYHSGQMQNIRDIINSL